MTMLSHLAGQLSYAGWSFRKQLHQSVERTNGGWWIPTIAVCVTWVLIDRENRRRS